MNSSSSSGNLSLPGGFKMANSSNKYCDVATATGSLNTQSIGNLVTEGFSKDWGLWSSHCQGSTVVSKWTWCLRESCRSTSWPSTSLASWSCWCPGSPSGWTTRRCQPGWPWGWPPCWPCPPPWARSRGVCPQWPTPRLSTSGQASASSSSSVLFLNMLSSTMHRGDLWNKCPLSPSIQRPKNLTYSKARPSLTFPNSNIELNLLAVVKWRISNQGRTPSELQSRRRWRKRSSSCAPSMQST